MLATKSTLRFTAKAQLWRLRGILRGSKGTKTTIRHRKLLPLFGGCVLSILLWNKWRRRNRWKEQQRWLALVYRACNTHAISSEQARELLLYGSEEQLAGMFDEDDPLEKKANGCSLY